MNGIEITLGILGAYQSVLVSLWTFYFAVTLGILGFLGAIRSSGKRMDLATKLLLTFLILFFGAGNYLSMLEVGGNISILQDHLISMVQNTANKDVLSSVKYARWSEHVSLTGYIIALVFAWWRQSENRIGAEESEPHEIGRNTTS